jgi:hypothetical protein
LLNKFVIKHIINVVALSKATEKFAGDKNIGKKARNREVECKMAEPLTNAIFAASNSPVSRKWVT